MVCVNLFVKNWTSLDDSQEPCLKWRYIIYLIWVFYVNGWTSSDKNLISSCEEVLKYNT